MNKKLKQIKDLYAYYHNISWIYRHSHKRNKKINYAVNTLSVLLASVGVITGVITLNPIILGTQQPENCLKVIMNSKT